MIDKLQDIFLLHRPERGSVIPILQTIQERHGFLSKESVRDLSKYTRVSENEIFGIATFYAQFRFKPPGKHTIKVCLGTACHVRGGMRILDTFERELEIHVGDTTEDRNFGLERVACVGCCALAPVVVVNKDVYGKTTMTGAKDILKKYGKGEKSLAKESS